MKTFFVLFTSAFIALVAYQWALLPALPETVSHQLHRHAIGFATRAAFHIGEFLDFCGIIGPEKVLRFVNNIGSAVLCQNSIADEVNIERMEIGSTPVVIIRPLKSVNSLLPVIIYFHGGGWTYGSPDTHLPFTAWLSKTVNMAVLSVDYGLSPETTYQSQIEECVNVAMNVLVNAHNFNVYADRIFIAGDSAGGNLAASTSLILASASHKIRGSAILFPSLQGVNFTLPSFVHYHYLFHVPVEYHFARRAGQRFTPGLKYAIGSGLHVPANVLKKWNRDYLNVSSIPDYEFPTKGMNLSLTEVVDFRADTSSLAVISKMVMDMRAFPLVASDDDLKTLPPTFIQAAEFDFLRDDALLYAHRLRKLNVPVTLSYLRDALHVETILSFFMKQPMSSPARTGLDDIAYFFKALQ